MIEVERLILIGCLLQASPPKPKLTPEKVEVMEGTSTCLGSLTLGAAAAEISCSCESRGNPSPSMEWHVSGLRVTNSTDRVISEEQLGNTGLRSSLTMRHSQGDTPTSPLPQHQHYRLIQP
ncbi:hypothetical protein SKAU_G00212130 [Synaphobranchus kaupii]|uniref:Ig-like domain-containing protein n=1 Tax=Synaphobranchus kaupii TaxID=118154 RepID=A0A9Q1F9M9_SYNKA|nr:hypothetical protein SKAU_G00212130 [Synaphobranchus kaupii]